MLVVGWSSRSTLVSWLFFILIRSSVFFFVSWKILLLFVFFLSELVFPNCFFETNVSLVNVSPFSRDLYCRTRCCVSSQNDGVKPNLYVLVHLSVCVFCLLRVCKGISIDGHVFVVGHSFEPFLGSILLIFGCLTNTQHNRWLVSSRC